MMRRCCATGWGECHWHGYPCWASVTALGNILCGTKLQARLYVSFHNSSSSAEQESISLQFKLFCYVFYNTET